MLRLSFITRRDLLQGAAGLGVLNFGSGVALGSMPRIQTIVGGGSIGDQGPCTSASLSTPWNMRVGADGKLYIADVYYHNIRVVTPATGIIATAAGNSLPGYTGDGGPATSATLRAPYNVAPDNFGNLYIADEGNGCIRRVDAQTGIISTVAGTGVPGFNGDGIGATSAQLSYPRDAMLGPGGLLYISDTANGRLRVVNMGTVAATLYPASGAPIVVQPGRIATAAGSGVLSPLGDGGPAVKARLSLPSGIALDSRGNIYIADLLNHRVRVIDSQTGIIQTLAGTGAPGATGDNGPAANAALAFPSNVAADTADNIYIGQQGAPRVRKVDAATKNITSVAGDLISAFGGDGGPATSAMLNGPTGVALDAGNSLYIADYNNARIRRVKSQTQVITTLVGSSNVGDNGASWQAVLNEPDGTAIDGQGRLLIADQGNHRVRMVSPGGIITTVAGSGLSGFGGDGGPATSARLNLPCEVKLDAGGNLFIVDLGNNRVRRVDAHSGIITTIAGSGKWGYSGDNGPATAAALKTVRSICFDRFGNLYLADFGNNRIRFVNLNGQGITLFAGGSNPLLVQPGIIVTVGGTGVAGSTGDGGLATDAPISAPRGVTLDSDGNLYFTEGGSDLQTPVFPPQPSFSKARRIDALSGIITTIAGVSTGGYNGDNIPAVSARLNGPRGLAFDVSNNLYIADTYNNRVRRVDAVSKIITTVVGTGVPGFRGDGGSPNAAQLLLPRYVTLDQAGILYVTDQGNSRIRRVVLG
jgi:sugar lactone lactonase YvrE